MLHLFIHLKHRRYANSIITKSGKLWVMAQVILVLNTDTQRLLFMWFNSSNTKRTFSFTRHPQWKNMHFVNLSVVSIEGVFMNEIFLGYA